MELQYGEFPNFYKNYEWIVEKENSNIYFCGRKNYLENYWLELCNLVGERFSRTNRTFIGQRKLGKTAYLQRCYNVTFWEQEKIIPFYYCFPQSVGMHLRETAREIVFHFIKQGISFITKEQIFSSIKLEELFFEKLQKKNFEWFRDLQVYWEATMKKIENNPAELVLREAWNVIDIFSGLFDKKCVVIIDEYQKTLEDLLDNGKPIACHESINKIVNNHNILTFISGSQISMLANQVLTSELDNRIPGETFFPLKEKEAHELILRYAGNNGFEGIEKAIFNMVGGNPYYIKILFTPTNFYYQQYDEPKKWSSIEDVEKTYNFEMLHLNGAVFTFWEKHLNEKYDLLNGDLPKHRGTTLKILKYIAEKERQVTLSELRGEFPHVKNMRKKMDNLRKADFIRTSKQSEEVFNFADVVLPVILTKMHQKLLLGTSSKKVFYQYQQEWFDTLAKRIRNVKTDINLNKDDIDNIREDRKKTKTKQHKIAREVAKTKRNIKKIETDVSNYFAKKSKDKASKIGKENLQKGMRAESKFQKNVTRYIKKEQGIFKNYKLVGKLQDINIKLTTGHGVQVDLFGELKATGNAKPKKYFLVGEMKDRKSKVTAKEAQKFQDKVNLVQIAHKSHNIVGIFICTGGFWKTASEMLKKNGIVYAKSDKIIQKL